MIGLRATGSGDNLPAGGMRTLLGRISCSSWGGATPPSLQCPTLQQNTCSPWSLCSSQAGSSRDIEWKQFIPSDFRDSKSDLNIIAINFIKKFVINYQTFALNSYCFGLSAVQYLQGCGNVGIIRLVNKVGIQGRAMPMSRQPCLVIVIHMRMLHNLIVKLQS